MDSWDLPKTVRGSATHRHLKVLQEKGHSERIIVPLDEAIDYEGYRLRSIVFAWSRPVTPDGKALYLEVELVGEHLTTQPPVLVRSVNAARHAAAGMYQFYRDKPPKDRG